MAELPILNIMLNDREIGTLAQLPGDRNLFVFNDDYINDNNRPTLSLSFKDTFGELMTHVKPTQTRLPAFFSNLLPEGWMRNYLAACASIKPEREFFLLWMLGQDLPGAIKAIPLDKASLPKNVKLRDNKTDIINASTDKVLRFSLAGIQLKFSAVKKARGGLTIPSNGVGGSWIVKLPDVQFDGVPENEFVMMALAREVGINVPETMLLPLGKIEGLPEGIEQAGTHAFAIKRFDRTEEGHRIHIEDFAQVFSVYPQKKYELASYRSIAQVIWAEIGEAGIADFIRRFVFNALIGNGDMHLKNWSFIYLDGRTPSLAPAYDFLSTIPYIKNDNLALKFVDSKDFNAINIAQFKRFAAKSGLPEHLVLSTVSETVERFAKAWQGVNALGIERRIQKIIDMHLRKIKLWKL